MMLRHRPRGDSASRDRGVSIVEMCVVIGILGVIMGAVATAISVVLKSEGGISTVVAESHDTQQVTNYFPLDVQTGPRLRSQYRGTADAVRGTGCGDAGSGNVFRYDDGTRRIAYRLVPDPASGAGRIDRYECGFDGTAWTAITVRNIADEIDTSVPSPVSVTFLQDGTRVERVVLSYAQRTGRVAEMTGSPRLDAAAAATSVGDCSDDPLDATAGFHVFSAGDVVLRSSANVLGALAVGGSLTFENGTGAGQDWGNTDPSFDPSTVRLYLNDVDWAASSGTMRQNVGDTRLQMEEGVDYVLTTSGRPKIRPVGQTSPEIVIDNGSIGVVPPGTVIDFAEAFDDLKTCSTLISMLPNAALCATCEHAALWGHNSVPPAPTPYLGVDDPTGYQVKIEMDPSGDGGPTLVNLSSEQLTSLDQISFYGTNRPGATTPLIFNVSGTDIDFNVPQIDGQGLYTNSIFWNFFEATDVTIDRSVTGAASETVWGSVFAPDAAVRSTEKIWGGVVAQRYEQIGWTVNSSRTFEAVIPWL
jgi:choice-of-anchor A domain-containing protein